jgi:hypothetical protein
MEERCCGHLGRQALPVGLAADLRPVAEVRNWAVGREHSLFVDNDTCRSAPFITC